jgi:4-oxalocrotonate tautomerase
MPIININMMRGRDVETKRKLAKALTDTVCETLGSPPEAVRVIINEMENEHYAVGGVLKLDSDPR